MQKKKGISLIVLVITIIVMIILASTIIISLNNNGIIDKAQDAVDKTNESQVKEIANLAWGEAYAANVGKKEEELLPILKTAVEKALSDNNLDKEDYFINVTTTGVKIKNINNVWIQKTDRTVVKGEKVLKIGSTIDYTDKAGENGAEKYTGDWKVLGAENGELLIMSAENVTTQVFNYNLQKVEEGKKAYERALDDLKKICEPYGTGAYATGARSITVEDVDRVTGYDKTTYERISGSYKIKYGESITYYWDNTSGKEEYPYYKTSRIEGNLGSSHSSFIYHNGKEWVTSTKPTSLTDKQEICTLTQTFYSYDVDNTTNLVQGTDAYNMLFGNDNVSYWLASTFFDGFWLAASFGLRIVHLGYVDGYGFVNPVWER